MTQTTTVRATEFSCRFAHYQDEAIRAKVIIVTSHERVVGGYLSADELARYERLKACEREVLVGGQLDDDVLADIQAAEYGAEAGSGHSLRFSLEPGRTERFRVARL